MAQKIVMTDLGGFPDTDLEEKLAGEKGYDFVCLKTTGEEELLAGAADADGLLVVYAQITERLINALGKCKIIVRAGIGYNNVDVEAASRRRIMFANVPDYCQGEVADHTMALLLTLTRKTAFLNNQVRKRNWSFNAARPIPRLAETTLGLYGCGSIARAVAQRARSFGIAIQGFDPYLPDELFAGLGIKKVDADTLFATSDFLSLHAPLTPETRHVVNAESLKKMKKNAVLINTARGPLVNLDDVCAALKQGVIAGAGLDVLETEPPAFPLALSELDNAVITPHSAYYSDSSEPELRQKAMQEAIRVLAGGRPKFWLNQKAFA
jgi:D-3-phosphoglycerate dehydrogenase